MDTVKRLLSLTLAVSLAAIPFSCKSFDPKLLEQRASFGEGVPAMRVVVNTDSIKACFPGGFRDKYHIRQEMRRFHQGLRPYPGVGFAPILLFGEHESLVNLIRHNLMFGKDSRNIYLSVLVRNIEWGQNSAWAPLAFVDLLWIFGLPRTSETVRIDLEGAVMNSMGKIIKTYNAKGKDTEYLAFYWGYWPTEGTQTAYTKALIAACADLRKQIEDDKDNLNKMIR